MIVMVGIDSPSTRILYHALAPTLPIDAVLIEPRVPRVRLLRARLRRLGGWTVTGQVLFQVILLPYLRARSTRRSAEILRDHSLRDTPIPVEKVMNVPSINHPDAVASLRRLAPRAVLLSGTRIVSGDVLKAIGVPCLNVHAGITPLYRGVHGAYWALVRRDPEHCGVTVHLVNEGIDTGPILHRTTIRPAKADDITTYPTLQLAAAIPLVRQALSDASEGRIRPLAPPPGRSRIWSHPTLWGYLEAWLTKGVR